MSPDDSHKEEPQPGLGDRFAGWKDRLIDLAVLSVPTLVVERVSAQLADGLVGEPLRTLGVLLPLAGLAVVAGLVARHRQGLALRGPMLVFLVCYVAVFSIAAGSDLLDGRRQPVVGVEGAPRSWLFPIAAGDWRHHLAHREPPDERLLVITVPPTPDLEAGRLQILQLVARAEKLGARGIAFDFQLRPSDSDSDERICYQIQTAAIPVIFGHHLYEAASARWRAAPLPAAFEDCLDPERRGHLMVLRDADGVVRLVPLRLEGRGQAAFSERIAALLRFPDTEPPTGVRDRFLHPIPPREDITPLGMEDLIELGDSGARTEIRNSFVLVGEDSPAERFVTPDGERLGVVLHAEAVHALLTGSAFRHTPSWLTFGVILVLCYLLVVRADAGAPASELVRIALWASLAVVATAALAAWWRVWLDVVYVLVAIWLLLPLLLLLRRQTESVTPQSPEKPPGTARPQTPDRSAPASARGSTPA